MNLSKQQGLDVEPKAIQQINFTGNLERQATTFFITKEALKLKLGIKKWYWSNNQLRYKKFLV